MSGANPGVCVSHRGRVLSIAKLRVGQEAYQLSGVAQSLDDYYTGRGEADGVWLGAGAERLGLAGEVDADDLRAVLAGMAPGSGGLTPDGSTVRTHRRRVPGFDLTFKAPKSVSVLYAVSDDPRVQGAIIDAGETAVRAALAWLEREAIRVRRGSGDVAYLNDLAARDPDAAERARQRPVPGRGVVAATFRHRTSRAPVIRCCTGTPWSPTWSKAPTGGGGRSCTPSCTGTPAPPGRCSRRCCAASSPTGSGWSGGPGATSPRSPASRRRCATCSRSGRRRSTPGCKRPAPPTTAAGRQAAVLATRRGKPEVEGERFDAAWKAEAIDAGWGPDDAEALIASVQAGSSLSVGANVSFVVMVTALTMIRYDLSGVAAIVAGLLAGLLVAAVNTALIILARVPDLVATLGTMFIFQGLALIITVGKSVSVGMPIGDGKVAPGSFTDAYRRLGNGKVLSVPVPVLFLFALALLTHVFLTHTRLGASALRDRR